MRPRLFVWLTNTGAEPVALPGRELAPGETARVPTAITFIPSLAAMIESAALTISDVPAS
jgi:hypothetical protein